MDVTHHQHRSHWAIDPAPNVTNLNPKQVKLKKMLNQPSSLNENHYEYNWKWATKSDEDRRARLLAAEDDQRTRLKGSSSSSSSYTQTHTLSNIENIMNRGEKLDVLQDKSDDLSLISKKFYQQAKKNKAGGLGFGNLFGSGGRMSQPKMEEPRDWEDEGEQSGMGGLFDDYDDVGVGGGGVQLVSISDTGGGRPGANMSKSELVRHGQRIQDENEKKLREIEAMVRDVQQIAAQNIGELQKQSLLLE
jgi:hypothetical protein